MECRRRGKATAPGQTSEAGARPSRSSSSNRKVGCCAFDVPLLPVETIGCLNQGRLGRAMPQDHQGTQGRLGAEALSEHSSLAKVVDTLLLRRAWLL